jgi:hypothetical protein
MDFVIDSTDLPTLEIAAQSLGFWTPGDPNATPPDPGSFKTQGSIPGDTDPYSSYFLNIVGTINDSNGNALPGYWSRLRINGNNPFADGLLTLPTTLIVYPPVKYLADGVTIDTTYTQPSYGMIA